MIELTTQKIIEVHDLVIKNFGGTSGVLYSGTLEKIKRWLKKNTPFQPHITSQLKLGQVELQNR